MIYIEALQLCVGPLRSDRLQILSLLRLPP